MKKVKLIIKTYPSTLEVYFSDEEKSVSVGSLSISTEVDFEIYDNPEDALEFEVGSVRDRILDFAEDNSFVLDDSSLDSELSKVESYYSLRVSDYFSKEVLALVNIKEMANHCYNHILITGSKENIDLFLNEIGYANSEIIDKTIYPKMIEMYGLKTNARWFELNIERNGDNNVTIFGDSAWKPSIDLFTDISEKYSFVIRYDYEEMGVDFSGWADINCGECQDNEFGYWEGLIIRDGEGSVWERLLDELEYFEDLEELLGSNMYSALSDEGKKDIVEAYNLALGS